MYFFSGVPQTSAGVMPASCATLRNVILGLEGDPLGQAGPDRPKLSKAGPAEKERPRIGDIKRANNWASDFLREISRPRGLITRASPGASWRNNAHQAIRSLQENRI